MSDVVCKGGGRRRGQKKHPGSQREEPYKLIAEDVTQYSKSEICGPSSCDLSKI